MSVVCKVYSVEHTYLITNRCFCALEQICVYVSRFQNQQRFHDSANSHPNWTLYGGSSNDYSNQYGDRSGFANSRLSRNNQEFGSNDVFSRRPQTSNNSYNSSDISEYNRNNRRFDSQGK